MSKQTISLNAYLQKKDEDAKPKKKSHKRHSSSLSHFSLKSPRNLDLKNKDPSNHVLDLVWQDLSHYGGLEVIQKCHNKIPSKHSNRHRASTRERNGFTNINLNQPIESQLKNNLHFDNPYSTWHMVRSYAIDQQQSLFPQKAIDNHSLFSAMREIQNKDYAAKQFIKAMDYFQNKQRDKGLKSLHESLKFDCSNFMAVKKRVDLYIEDGSPAEALAVVTKALGTTPSNRNLIILKDSLTAKYDLKPTNGSVRKRSPRRQLEEKEASKKFRPNHRYPLQSISPPIYTPDPM